MKAIYFDGDKGEKVRHEEIPVNLVPAAQDQREILVDQASMFSDVLTEAILEEQEITAEMIIDGIRQGVVERRLTPVFIGSAYKNKGIQPLLDAVTQLLPCPLDMKSKSPWLPWLSNWKTGPTAS
jgi:elongation factor G